MDLAIAEGMSVKAIELPAGEVNAKGQSSPTTLKMVPYYAWSNRDVGSMQVWFPTSAREVEYRRGVVDSPFKSVTASHTNPSDSVEAMIDAAQVGGSGDTGAGRWTSWDHRGEPQWVEAELKEPATIRSVGVYWYDDGGGVQVPVDWNVELRSNGTWKSLDLYVTDAYQMNRDQLNIVHPASPVKADAIRVNMTPKPDACVGIVELEVQTE